uniref:Glycoside hydrolase family 19 catalytic domain-containing protein n=1 Tax=Fagus sylvatica TaxID=28930 RepID=A0A2N9F4S7_FAGSY
MCPVMCNAHAHLSLVNPVNSLLPSRKLSTFSLSPLSRPPSPLNRRSPCPERAAAPNPSLYRHSQSVPQPPPTPSSPFFSRHSSDPLRGSRFLSDLGLKRFSRHSSHPLRGADKVASREPLAWGLCYNKEMNSNSYYCDEHYNNTYPCAHGVAYYGRGALPIYWNYNYGEAGKALKVDLLNHPEYIEQNATLAFQVAIWRWMTPIKEHQPSAHDVFIGYWKPTKNDTLAKRVSGFGATMNVLYGDLVCGEDDNESMNNIISHYLYYLDLMGVGREEAGPQQVLSCAQQVAFNPFSSSSP